MSQADLKPDRGSPPGTPRWVKLFGIIGIIVVLLIVIILVTELGGSHGPGRHLPSGNAVETPPTSVIEDQTPPIENGDQQP